MPTFPNYCFAKVNEAKIYESVVNNKGSKLVNSVLMGTWLGIKNQVPGWLEVETAGPGGWIEETDTTDEMAMKMFFIDVGQGDSVLIEVGDIRIIVDGGPNSHLKNYLSKWQYYYDITETNKIKIDYVFISHFDGDHYHGFIDLINDTRFSFGTIFHNGIARMKTKQSDRPANYDTDLGETDNPNNRQYLLTTFDDLQSLTALKVNGGLQDGFKELAEAMEDAAQQGRLTGIQRLTSNDNSILGNTYFNKNFEVQVLGPIVNQTQNGIQYRWFKDSSKTRNGHSLVLKFIYKNASILLGGDLNEIAEHHLMDNAADTSLFECDVAKSCHHGSSDFSIDYLKLVNPIATVISSGDNESYSHPRADAIGCSGKYSKSDRPLVFSTELARSINKSGDILFGMINLRTNGDNIYMAQMKERKIGTDLWDSYEVK